MIGTTLNHYQILEKLGSGGMGDVYLAEDTRLNRKIALKVLPPEMAKDAERRKRFEREVQTVAALNHPNIVTIFSVEESEKLHFYTMEYVQGRVLSDMIPERGYQPRGYCEIAIPLVEAVAAAHNNGITHRDLKPANVMVSGDGRVKVLDFGLAKLNEPAPLEDAETFVASDALTQIGRVLGTIAYMSPEQAEGKLVDERSDIFSLGIILYQMATGDSPFKGDTQISMVSSILKDQPISVSDLNPKLPSKLARIIHRCLEKDPKRRYSSADELGQELTQLKKEIDTGELLASTGSFSALWKRGSGPLGRVFRKILGLRSVAVWAAVAAAIILSVGFWNRDKPTSALVSPDRQSMAVFYFQNITGDESLDWLRTGLTDMLITDLAQSRDLRVLTTDRLYQILEQMGRLDQEQLPFNVVQAVAREAGVGTAVLGSFVKAGDVLRINVRLQDTESGDVISSERIEGEGESAIFSMVDDLTRRIKRNFALASLQEDQADRDLQSVTTDSVEAYRFYVRGIEQHGRGNEREAVPMFERSVELDPNFAMALAKLSVSEGNLGEHKKAQEFAERALEHVDRLSDRERYYIEGRYYSLDESGLDRALEAYRKAVELFPDHHAARNNLALLYIRQKNYQEAVVHLEELRKRKMSFPGTYGTLAETYAELGEYQKGLEVLREYLEREPENASGYMYLGQHYLVSGKYSDAIVAMKKAEELMPGEPQLNLWVALVLADRWEEAAEAAAGVRGSKSRMSWLGSAYEGIQNLYFGHVDGALKDFEAAVQMSPEGSPLHFQAAELEVIFSQRAGRYKRALQLVEPILEQSNEDDVRFGALCAGTLASLKSGDVQQADRFAEQFLGGLKSGDQDSKRAGAILRGQIALAKKEYTEAISRFKEAVPLLPEGIKQTTDSADVWFGLGAANWELGSREEAAKWFRTVVESPPQRVFAPLVYVRSHYFLGLFHEDKGEIEKAQRYFRIFLKYWQDGEIDQDRVQSVVARLSP